MNPQTLLREAQARDTGKWPTPAPDMDMETLTDLMSEADKPHAAANDPPLAEALIGIIKVATMALWTSGRALDVEVLAQMLNVRNEHVRAVLQILAGAEWCDYDRLTDLFYPKGDLWTLSHNMEQHLIKVLGIFTARLLERTGLSAEGAP